MIYMKKKINVMSVQIDKLDKHIESLKDDLENIEKTNSAVIKLQQLLNIPIDTNKTDFKKITDSMNITLAKHIDLETIHKISESLIP